MTQHPTVETFAEAVAEIERRFKCVRFTHSLDVEHTRVPSIAPTNVSYTELMSGQVKVPGEMPAAMAFTEKAAAQLLLDGVLRLGEGKSTIYWRIEPEMDDTFPVFFEVSAMLGEPFPHYEKNKAYRTYCRLAFE